MVKRVLEGRKAEYAVLSGLVADQIAQVAAPEYSGLFSLVAAFLTGGLS